MGDGISDEKRGLGKRAITDEQRGLGVVQRGLGPPTHKRCRRYIMASVPSTYAAFEQEIEQWIATCVTSRTNQIHREKPLVRGNPSLVQLWPRLTPGQRATIIPKYTGRYRVENIEFSSPQAQTATPSRSTSSRSAPTRVGPPSRTRAPVPSRDLARKIKVQKPPPYKFTDPPFPDDAKGLILDAKKLAKQLRKEGNFWDASMLEHLAKQALGYLTDISIVIGAYYIGTKLIAGRLFFQWTWFATGYRFHRGLARVSSRIDELSKALRQIVDIGKRHKVRGGAGLDWNVLDEIVDPKVAGQIDDYACGPACVQIVLGDRGISVSQDSIAAEARAWEKLGVKTKETSDEALAQILNELDKSTKRVWRPGLPVHPHPQATTLDLARLLSTTGSWIARVGKHFVVVDGIDHAGHVLIRDPWRNPGARTGTRYRVTWTEFVKWWDGGIVIYAHPR